MSSFLKNKLFLYPALAPALLGLAYIIIIPFFWQGWEGFPHQEVENLAVVVYFGVGIYLLIKLVFKKDFKPILPLILGYATGVLLFVLSLIPMLFLVCLLHGLCL